MSAEKIELIGTCVRLVPMEPEHREPLFLAGSHPEIWTYLPVRVQTQAQMDNLIAEALRCRDAGTEFPFVIIDLATRRVVGSTRLMDIDHANRSLEIGWTWHSPEVWRTRINTECKYLLLRHCFETWGTIRVCLKTDARNERSQRAIERIGGVREGVMRHHRILPDGYRRDSVYYSILEAEWPAVKARLEGFLRD